MRSGAGTGLAGAVMGAMSILITSCFARPPVPGNVLLITLDTTRADRLGSYGYSKNVTPHLDALARDAVRFDNAFTVAPLTAPVHAAMLTGRYPLANGLRNNGTHILPQEEVLVSETLRAHGFRTGAIVSALVLRSDFGLNQGWDLYYEEGITGSGKKRGLWYDQRKGDLTADRALAWLEAEGDRPFFLWVHFFDPHAPYDPPSPFKEQYRDAPYDGEVAFMDAQVGRLLDRLRSMGLFDSTLVIVAGDHGEALGEHGEPHHGIFLYDVTTRVPLIVRAPGGARGSVVSDLASTLDVGPTILDALGQPIPDNAQGVSLMQAVRGAGRVPARSLFVESVHGAGAHGWAIVRAFIQSRWKLVDLPKPELYDLASDPNESTNLSVTEPARYAAMRSDYGQLLAQIEQDARQAETAEIDDETRDQLISLGYIGGQQSEATARVGPDPKDMAFMIIPLGIARKFMMEGEYAQAQQVFEKALEVDPQNRMALLNMAKALAAQGKLEEAVTYFDRLLVTYPDVEEFYRVYGWVYLGYGRFEAAAAVFRKGLEHIPTSGHLHFMLGYIRFLARDWSGASEELDLAIRLSPRFGKPHYLLAICRLQEGDEPGAVTALEQYLERDSDVDSLYADPYFASLRQKAAFQDLVKRHL